MIGIFLTVFLFTGLVEGQFVTPATCDVQAQVQCVNALINVVFNSPDINQRCRAVVDFYSCVMQIPGCDGEATYNSTLAQLSRQDANYIDACIGIVSTVRPTTYTPRPWTTYSPRPWTTRYPTYTPKPWTTYYPTYTPWPVTHYPTDNECFGKVQYCVDVLIGTINAQQGQINKDICPLAEHAFDCLNKLMQCIDVAEYRNTVQYMENYKLSDMCHLLPPMVSKASGVNSLLLPLITGFLGALYFL